MVKQNVGYHRHIGESDFSNSQDRQTDGPKPNDSEVSEVVFSDAENLPLVASLCRWQRCKAVMPDLIGHPLNNNVILIPRLAVILSEDE